MKSTQIKLAISTFWPHNTLSYWGHACMEIISTNCPRTCWHLLCFAILCFPFFQFHHFHLNWTGTPAFTQLVRKSPVFLPSIHIRIHNSPPPDRILHQINPFNAHNAQVLFRTFPLNVWVHYSLPRDFVITHQPKQTPWPESASELYRPSDRCLSPKLRPTFADRGCHEASAMDPLRP
jgi:hypothetical protein